MPAIVIPYFERIKTLGTPVGNGIRGAARGAAWLARPQTVIQLENYC
jgi:hypothetical protein